MSHKATHQNNNPVWVGEEDFPVRLLTPRCPVLVAFLASWSRPCKTMEAIIDKVAAAFAEKIAVLKVNADCHPALSLLYDVQSLPTLLFFVKGTIRDRLVGTASSKAVIAKLRALASDGASQPAHPRPQHPK